MGDVLFTFAPGKAMNAEMSLSRFSPNEKRAMSVTFN